MIITKEQQEAWVNAYIKEKHTQDECIGFIDGIKINKIDELVAAGYDLKKIAENGFDSYFKQIFEWGYFHADPHPGNLFVLPGNRIGILDFGMVGRLTEKDRKALVEFIIGLGRDDIGRIVENVEKLQGSEIEDKPALEIDMAAFISDFGGQAARDIDLNDALNRGRFLINKHHLKLNPDLFLLLRAVSMLEGIGTTLDKDFRSLEIIKPFAIKLLSKSLNPRNIFKNKTVIAALADLGQLAVSLPADARKIIDKIKNDKKHNSYQHFRCFSFNCSSPNTLSFNGLQLAGWKKNQPSKRQQWKNNRFGNGLFTKSGKGTFYLVSTGLQ
jgi:ubiquinone biosynthesis protein